MDLTHYNGCLSLPREYASATDFKASTTIKLDYSVKLPNHFSLGEWIYSTNYQGAYGSCTANSTSHGVQVLNVKAGGKKPVDCNIITPSWRDLWSKMGHNLNDINDSGDYVEKAVNTALKNGISNEEGGVSTFDGYATEDWTRDDKGIELMKRYIYNGNPIVWCLQGNGTTWSELSAGELKTDISISNRDGGHAVACVGWDEAGFWFVNSWRTNDGKGLKSRFLVRYKFIKSTTMFNWRYWLPFKQEQVPLDTEYIKRKNRHIVVLSALKKTYPEESDEMKKAIEQFSKAVRKNYPEINDELPLNS